MDFSVYTGKKSIDVKTELESLGYRVIIVENSNNPKDNSISLVVRARKYDDNTIELVCSQFLFLS